ncbi:hypothetical protein PFISCL1PPCAC_14281, partial [Pristionchus fissidentatus]
RLRFDCFLIDFRLVIIIKGALISSVCSAHHIIVVLSLERLYSSIYPAHFEKYSNRLLASFLAICAVRATLTGVKFFVNIQIISTSFYTFSFVTGNFQLFYEHYVTVFNERVEGNAQTFSNFLIFMTISCVLSIALLCVDFYLNFVRRRVADMSLAVSYQFGENRRVILILLPIEIVDTLLNLITPVALILY